MSFQKSEYQTRKLIVLFCFLIILIIPLPSICQEGNVEKDDPRQKMIETFREINIQVWEPFIRTYSSFDAEGFLGIHSRDLLRIPRDSRRISTYDEYFERMVVNSENSLSAGRTRLIEFSFEERFHNENYASEVGFYKVITNPGMDSERIFYGKFHVILTREDGTWKILLDSDTSENGTIGQEEFENGHKMDDFTPFID